MSKHLFQEFDKSSSKAWKQKIQVDLKGADYNEALVWNTPENISVKPFYHPDEFDDKQFASHKKNGHWKVGQIIMVTDELQANIEAKNALSKGAEDILFKLKKQDEISMALLTKDLQNASISIMDWNQNGSFPDAVNTYFDPIGHLASTGNWYDSMEIDLKQMDAYIINNGKLSMDMAYYQNAGANMVQQLAYSLAHLNEYLNHFNKLDDFDFSNCRLHFNIAVGGNYFFEIAKIRALRILWQSLSKVYGAPEDCTISAVPSRRNKSIYDYNVNMLRTTTECMSAILGGADTIYNLPYDALYHQPNEFGDRIARNQLLILKHESYFDQVRNPADGAYYIESLTEQLADKALELFKDIENSGGFLKQLKSGTIQRKIKESAKAEQTKFDTGELVLLGVNTFPNEEDQMKNNLEIDPFLSVSSRKTLIEPIIQIRLSESLEKNRLKQE
jgi:methylmalonyl-CoA mutase